MATCTAVPGAVARGRVQAIIKHHNASPAVSHSHTLCKPHPHLHDVHRHDVPSSACLPWHKNDDECGVSLTQRDH